jgi:hypothetical protein
MNLRQVSAKKVKIDARTRARNSHYARAAFPNAGIPHNPIGSFGIGFSSKNAVSHSRPSESMHSPQLCQRTPGIIHFLSGFRNKRKIFFP